jgi:DNA-directed RNA polymerase specialized sigma24 family protein
MEQRKPKWRGPTTAAEIDELLTGRYAQLLKWGSVLTRGDAGKAQDIVQEFCLYFTLAKPDLSDVSNLDGYLYTCLRHIFLSSLARASREALHFVSTADFESFDFALDGNRPGDLLQRQNDLRRICAYAVWRKKTSKSASYFILHFYHGYSRREVGEMARLPLSAIYNKLKAARSEVKSYLERSGKLRIVDRELPSPPVLSWTLSSSVELFKELRQTILQARNSECLPEAELIALYLSSPPAAIGCSLLAHIVSCELCLTVIDRHFRRPTLIDREPLDSLDSSSSRSNDSAAGTSSVTQRAMMRSLRRRWGGIHEHRPISLSIAVNGQIVAFHDVQGERSTLSARINQPEKAQFVEVFSEHDIRLALLPIDQLPPHGSSMRSQRIQLSDDRWLELVLTFDGLGLNSEVAYFDPALAVDLAEEREAALFTQEASVEPGYEGRSEVPRAEPWLRTVCATFMRSLRALVPSSALAWALTLTIIIGTAGYFAYRHISPPINAAELLKESVKAETASLQGQTEHQVFQIEELSTEGRVLQQGTVDQWRDGDGSRYIRRLYDSQNRLVATKWLDKNGEDHSHLQGERRTPSNQRESPDIAEFLDQNLSAQSFGALEGKEVRAHAVSGGYELTTLGPTEAHPQLISATLTLDKDLLPVREVLRMRRGGQTRDLRLVQTSYERKPSSSVPDTVFDSRNTEVSPFAHKGSTHSGLDQRFPSVIGNGVQLAELQIDVLYRLHALGADTGEPIEVVGTRDGRVRVSGTVADDMLRRKIVSSLETSNSRQLLDLRLTSLGDGRLGAHKHQLAQIVETYDVTQSRFPAEAAVQNYLRGKGLSGAKLDSAAEQFSNEMLQHSQTALQDAYALDRLGNVLSTAPLQSIGVSSRQKWSEMVANHTTGLEEQLRLLRAQLSWIAAKGNEPNGNDATSLKIEDPAGFERAASALLRQTQEMNEYVGIAFASGPANETENPHPDALLAKVASAVPSRQANEVGQFALRLNTSASAHVLNQGTGPASTKASDRRE